MSKVSSNAGKHPYLRVENENMFYFLIPEHEGIPFPKGLNPVFENPVDTEYVDKKKNKLFFRDVVTYEKEEYTIDYAFREFSWVMVNVKNPKKVEILREKAHLSILKKKYN